MNPLAFAALLAPAVLGAPVRGTLDVGDRSEARGGYLGLPTDPALNLETVPSATLSVGTRRATFMLQYAPRFGLTDVQIELRPYLLHAGAAGLDWRNRWVRLTLNEVASYGDLNTTSALPASVLAPGTGGPTTSSPAGPDPGIPMTTAPGASTPGIVGAATPARPSGRTFERLRYQASTTTLAAVFTPERAWSLRLALSYTLSGGADETARRILAYQYGPRFEATFAHAVSKRDHLITQSSLEQSTVLSVIARSRNGVPIEALNATYEYVFIRATQGWAHQFSRAHEASISAGVTGVHSNLLVVDRLAPPAPPDRFWTPYPTAEVSWTQHLPLPDRFDVQLRALVTPAANRLTGLLSQQMQGILSANWKRARMTYLAEGAFAQSLRADRFIPRGTDQELSTALTYASLRLGAGYAVTRYCTIEGGLILTHQKAGDFPALSQRMAYVALALRHPTFEF